MKGIESTIYFSIISLVRLCLTVIVIQMTLTSFTSLLWQYCKLQMDLNTRQNDLDQLRFDSHFLLIQLLITVSAVSFLRRLNGAADRGITNRRCENKT